MNNDDIKLVTIFTEAALESQLVKDIDSLGAPGYTITNARGKGRRGLRGASWEANSNIRVEIICAQPVAEDILAHLHKTYYDNYAMVSFSNDIQVLRPEKFNP